MEPAACPAARRAVQGPCAAIAGRSARQQHTETAPANELEKLANLRDVARRRTSARMDGIGK